MYNLLQEDIHHFLTICHFSSPNTTPPQKNLISFYSDTHSKWCKCGYRKCSLMKLISRHNGRRFAEQNGPEGKERKSHTLLILLYIFHFPLNRKLLANKKEKESKYNIINKLTGSKVFQQPEALFSCSLFQNQAGLCCSISTETKKNKKIIAFLEPKLYLLLSVIQRRHTAVINHQYEYICKTEIQDLKAEVSFAIIEAKK